MNKLKIAALILIIAGVVVMALGAAQGQGEVMIFLFIPVYRGTGPYALGGGLLIFLGIVTGMIYLFKPYLPAPYEKYGETRKVGESGQPPTGERLRHGGVVFLGPIPIAWGSDARAALYAIIIGIALILAVLIGIFLYFIYSALP